MATQNENQQAATSSTADFCVTPQMFGAVGNGIADDTSACQQAAAAALSDSKPLLFPNGTYKISETIDVGRIPYVTGLSRAGSVIRMTDVTKPILKIGNVTSAYLGKLFLGYPAPHRLL